MAVQRYISSSFWSDDWVDSLNIKEKLVYLYLLTNDSTSICGVYKLTIKRIKDDTGVLREEIREILQKFTDDKKAYYVDEYIILPNWLKHQHLSNESVKLGTIRALRELPAHIIAFLREPEHFYYDIDVLLGAKKEVKHPQPDANTTTETPEQTASQTEKTAQNDREPTQSDGESEQKTIAQNNMSARGQKGAAPPKNHPPPPKSGVAPPKLGGAPTQHPQNTSKSAHDSDSDLDSDLERDRLNSLDIPTLLEREGESEREKAPEEPAPLPKNQTGAKKSSRFIKPTVQEIADYCRLRNNTVDPDTFFNFYESKNWFVGKNKMSSWKAAIHTWESKDRQWLARSPPRVNNKQYDYNTTGAQEEMPF